jgi:metal-responsive CopG/Arc/MetJ family transcriptional regulator
MKDFIKKVREEAGLPEQDTPVKRAVISAQIEQRAIEAVDSIASIAGMTRSDVVRVAIMRVVEEALHEKVITRDAE